MKKAAELIQVGVIVGAHGIRGQVRIRCLIDSPDCMLSTEKLTDSTGKIPFRLTRHGRKDALLIAAIEGIADRNAAEKLKGTGLYLPPECLPEKRENEWYPHELTGLEARLSDGSAYGRVTGMVNFGAGDILEIALVSGGAEMLPFAKAFIGDIHMDKGYLVVMPPEYIEAKE